MNLLFAANVPDPTDFPPLNVAPGLRTLDGAFRCNICGELYDAPVTLNCGHCFCSFCIRSSLAEKQECPTCRKMAMDGHIRPNPVVEEVVSTWKLSRPYVLRLSKEDEHRNTTSSATPPAKRRKTTHESTNRSGSSTSSSGLGPGSPSKTKRRRQDSEDTIDPAIPTSEAEEDENLEDHKTVDCPLCNKRVPFKSINRHMDSGCKDGSNRSAMAGWKKLMAPPSKGKQKESSDNEDNHRLAKVSYVTLKDRQLKDMLVEQKLATNGDRNQCIHRHQRWVMIYNANLDRSPNIRKSIAELRKELKRWEEEKSKKRKTVVDDPVAHQKRHKDDFKQLVEAARCVKSSLSAGSPSKADEAGNSITNTSGGVQGKDKGSGQRDMGAEPEEAVIVVDSEGEQEMA